MKTLTKEYKCICGRIFDNPQKFNGHKQGCKEHIINKYGSLEEYYRIKNRNHDCGTKLKQKKLHQNKQQQLQKWINEQHTCEKCGKIMTEKFGSGRFCSRGCANSRERSEETKQKISQSLCNQIIDSDGQLKKVNLKPTKKEWNEFNYIDNPSFCSICLSFMDYESRNNKTCGKFSCVREHQSCTMKNIVAKNGIHQTYNKRYKYGTYKGIHCDSSWELAFVMYCLDNDITFSRNTTEHFPYYFNNELHEFYPDFVIGDTYIEIKNYHSDLTNAKVEQFPRNKKLVVFYYRDMKHYINYVVNKYGKDFIKLYDRTMPSWMDHE